MAKFISNTPIQGYHGVTTRINTLQEVCDYEEEKIKLNFGYPRFVPHPEIRKLEEKVRKKCNALSALSFCSLDSAIFAIIDYYFNKGAQFYIEDKRAQSIVNFLKKSWGKLIVNSGIKEAQIIIVPSTKRTEKKEKKKQVVVGVRNSLQNNFGNNFDIVVTGDDDRGFIILFTDLEEEIFLMRRNNGFNLSSRRAERINTGKFLKEDEIIHKVKEKISRLEKTKPEHCLLYPSGMAAVFSSLISSISKDRRKLIGVGNCYVDTLCILKNWPKRKGTITSPIILEVNDKQRIRKALKGAAAVIMEVPTNPLLQVPDLEHIIHLAHNRGVKVIIDNTVATPYNLNPLMLGADITLHSTTKFLNGNNDHLGGCVLTNDKELLERLYNFSRITNLYLDLEDAQVLNKNLDGFEQRMKLINKNALQVANFLRKHPSIGEVYYPGLPGNSNLALEKKYLRGYSGLISFVVKDSNKQRASSFYNNITDPIIKGPRLGAEQTLLCPYTLLAHYQDSEKELKHLGLDRYLFRISVGTEQVDKIIESLSKALHKYN